MLFIVWIYHSLFIHSNDDGPGCCSHFGDILAHVHLLLHISPGYILESRLAGHWICLYSMWVDDPKQFSKVKYLFILPLHVSQFQLLCIFANIWRVWSFSFELSGFNGVSLIKPFVMCLLAFGYPLLWSASSSHYPSLMFFFF